MSFHINSDKEKIRGVNPKLIGDNETTIRVGSGANEREVFRAELDVQSGLPRIGINRTGQRVNNIDVTAGGGGYTQAPTVVIDAPPAGGTQALASAFIFNGAVVSVAVNDPGNGYTTAPNVSFTGGNGAGAAATAVLDTVDFELDINGAIRTSTSIISDTARILNLDIENFVTPDLNLRAPNLKTYMNGTGTPWAANVIVPENSYRYSQGNVYQALNTGTTGTGAPIHKDGIAVNGEVQFKHIGFRVTDPNDYKFLETGESGIFPRSITPLLGDRSDKIATTEYVLNLATNDVGGRVYVSQQIGSDLNDGRSAVNPVRTIKKAAQIAWSTPGVKETLIVSGGDYVEDNPISLPPDCSVVGDNLRLVIIRPANLGKHIFKFGDKNYVTGVTYRDKVDANGDPIGTWDFAMVFDDKQRIIIDNEINGDFGVNFPIGHQIFGPERFRITFQNNTGLSLLQSGVQLVGLNTGARVDTFNVSFNSTTGANAYISGTVDVLLNSGSLIEGDQYRYVTSASTGSQLALTISSTSGANRLRFTSDPTSDIPSGTYVFLNDTDNSSFSSGYYQVVSIDVSNAPTYWDVLFVPVLGAPNWDSNVSETVTINAATPVENTIDTVNLKSIRAEGEVVSYDEDVTSTLPISRIDFSLQGDPSIATGGFQEAQFGSAEDLGGIVFYTNALVGRTNTHDFKEGQEIEIEGLPTVSPDLSFLNGKQRIYKVLEDADGRARRFVIPKKFPGLTNANFNPGEFAKVKSYSKVVTLSLLNSPNKFALSTPVERRFQDACQLIRNNRDYIAEEVVGIINDQFKSDYYSVYNLDAVNNTFDIYLGPLDHANTYVSGGTVSFGGNSYAISGFVYDTVVTGVATITTTAAAIAALSEDDTVQLADILISCEAGQKLYPAYSSPTNTNSGTNGDEQCKQDVIHFLNALVRDLEFGSNHNIIEAAKKYIVGGKIAYIEDEIIQNVRAIEYARELAIYAMCNWRIKNRTTADPLYVTKHATTTRYTDPTIITTTAGSPACADVEAAISTLSYLWVDVISNNTSGTYLDAAYLIARNADLIADQALINTEVAYPTLNLSDLHQRKCRRDIKLVIEGLVRDLSLGGNHGVISAAESYFSGTVLSGIQEAQLDETRYAFQQVRDLCIAAMRNWSDGDVLATTPTGSTYVPATGAMTVVIPDPAVAPVANSDRIAFAEGAITYSCAHGGGGTDASPYRTDANFGQSFLITGVTSSGGSTTLSLNPGVAGSNTDAHTFSSALANGTKIIYAPVATTSPVPKFEDWSILEDAANPSCAAIASAITTSMATFDSILQYATDTVNGTAPGSITQTFGTLYDTAPIISYPSSYIYDFNNQRMAIRGDFDDFPIIEASPYTQNASVISFRGGGGALIDGDKVKQPNCPFPGLEPDGTASFPNQGKSMVAAAFTIVSFGGTGYKVINDGYTQLVSVFVIFCQDGVLCESGGYASITNSATNFGTFALRGVGFRDEAYNFDVGTITEVGQTVTGKTTFEVSGLGRKPLEHYIVKIDGIRNTNETIEYFIDSVVGGAAGAPAVITLEGGNGLPTDFTDVSTGNPVSNSSMLSKTIRLHRPSIVNSSSHTWEFAGSGTDYNALPENGGVKVESREQVPQNYGRVYVSGTDELGDFKVGTFAKIENRTGAITFTGTVSISEVEFLKLKGGDVVVTGFSSDNTLGGSQSSNSLISTQKAVRDFIVNNLGLYINKPYSTNPVPRALVELTDAGTINIDQLPPIRPFSVFTVDTEEERLRLEGALAGDIAIQENSVAGGGNGATESFILNNDNASLFLGFPVDTGLQFSVNSIYTGSTTGGKIQATEYRQGVVFQLNITDGGSGYTAAPVVTISGGNLQSGGEPAVATATISGGQVVTVELYFNNGYTGGKGYTTQPSVTIDAPTNPDGSTATAEALIESRLYGDIVNNIKITDNDTVQDSSASPQTVTLTRVINTSGTSADNWVSLSSNQIAAGDITSGIISTARLANDSAAANSFTFLRGDQSYSEAVQSIKGPEERYFLKTLSSVGSGSSQISVPYSENIIIGHEVDGTGIADDTIIQSFIVSLDGTTITITLDKPTDDTIPADTVINFTRNPSPILLSSNQSEGNFIDSIVIANGGTGCTVDNQPNGIARNVSLGGGAGTGLTANITVTSGVVTSVVVVDPGSGYSNDFVVTPFPPELGSGSFLVLQAKKSTTNRMYANTTIDVARVTDGTTDDYGTLGLARFAKAQFEIGLAGDGSVRLKTGDASNLDADRLDGFEGSYYLNASNLAEGTIGTNRLSGTYNIGISGQAGSARRLYWQETAVNSPVTPSEIPEGITITPKNDGVNGLSDCPDPVNDPKPYLLVNIRASETNGGSRQLAFTDGPGDDSGGGFWFRGSNDTLSQFKNWYKVWTSGSDGPASGLDADKLESREGIWYQNSLNQTAGYLRDGRIPKFQTSKSFLDEVCVYDWSAAVYQFYVNVDVNTTTLGIVTATPFLVGDTITVFDATGGNLGTAVIKNVFSNIDGNDSQNNYLIVTATYNSGSNPDTNWKNLGKTIGGTNNGGVEVKVAYQDFDISNYDADANNIVDGAFTISKLKSDNGTALLEMGRVTGSNSTTPAIRLFTEGSANWQSAIVASGNGQTSQQSGNLEFLVNDVNSVKVNANVLWNAGNVTITSTNSGSTYTNNNADFDAANPENNLVLRNVVMRDKDGNFSAGTITADLEGSASGNLSSDGGTITGNLEIANGFGLTLAGGNLGVNGTIIGSDDFKIDTTNNLFIVDVSEGKVGVSKSPASDDGKFSVYGTGRNDLTVRTSDNTADQGIAYQNSGGSYTWNLMRADVGSNRADFIILGNSTSGPESNINSLNDYFRIRAGGDVKISQNLGIGRNPTDKFDVDGNIRTDKLIVKADGSNPGAVVELISSGTGGNARNFRLNAATDDIFRIQSSSSDGGTSFNSTGAININANNNRVGIDIDPSTASTDNAGDSITGGGYQLYVNGSLNVQGTVYQNGLPFSGSNWTLSGSNIYRNTTVAIGTNSISTSGATNQKLQVNGGIAMNGSLVVNGNYLWIDNNAVIRTSLDTISQNITIDAGISASSTGPITVSSGTTITVNGSWAIQ